MVPQVNVEVCEPKSVVDSFVKYVLSTSIHTFSMTYLLPEVCQTPI